MADYSQFFKKPEDEQPMDVDQDKLAAYSNYLDTNDPKQNIRDMMDKQMDNKAKAVDIASRGPFQEKTPEDQAFEEQHLDPLTRGLIGGGVMGSTTSVAGPAKEAVGLFPKMRQMFQVGSHQFEAGSPAEALKIKQALEQQGLTMPGRPLIKK